MQGLIETDNRDTKWEVFYWMAAHAAELLMRIRILTAFVSSQQRLHTGMLDASSETGMSKLQAPISACARAGNCREETV